MENPQTRPLPSVGALFSAAWGIYRTRIGVLIGLVALSFGVTVGAAAFVFGGSIFGLTVFSGASEASLLAGALVWGILGTLVIVAAQLWVTTALSVAVARSAENLGFGASLREGWKLLLPVAFVSFLVSLAVAGGFLLLLIPALIVGIFVGFATWVAILEGVRGVNALARSWQMVSGRWLAVFGRMLIPILLSIVLSIVLSILSGDPEEGSTSPLASLLSLAIPFVLTPLLTAYQFVLYRGLAATAPAADAAALVPFRKKVTVFWVLGTVATVLAIALPSVFLGWLLTSDDAANLNLDFDLDALLENLNASDFDAAGDTQLANTNAGGLDATTPAPDLGDADLDFDINAALENLNLAVE